MFIGGVRVVSNDASKFIERLPKLRYVSEKIFIAPNYSNFNTQS